MSAIEALKHLLDMAEVETPPDGQIETLFVPIDIVREILAWADEAQEAVNHNAKLVEEERLKHELYKKDGEISALRFVIETLFDS